MRSPDVAVRARRALAGFVDSRGVHSRSARFVVGRACKSRGCSLVVHDRTLDIVKEAQIVRLSSDDLVHAPHVAGCFEVFFGAVVPEREGDYFVVDYSTPRVHHYIPLDLALEIPGMQERIPVEDLYMAFSMPSAGDLVFDIGANIGVVSISLSRAVGPEGSVVAFEPDPANADVLRRNIAASGLRNITVVEAAIADTDGQASFIAEGSIGSGLDSARSQSLLAGHAAAKVTVPTISLHAAFRSYGVPSWIKMDIEGAEVVALNAARSDLANHQPMLAIETDHVLGNTTTAGEVERILGECGYGVVTKRSHGTQMTWTTRRPGGV